MFLVVVQPNLWEGGVKAIALHIVGLQEYYSIVCMYVRFKNWKRWGVGSSIRFCGVHVRANEFFFPACACE